MTIKTRTRAEKAARTKRLKARLALSLPRPGEVKRAESAVRFTKDGREICTNTEAGRFEYRRRTFLMAEAQDWKCGICKHWMTTADVTFEHTDLRSGGRRNDTIHPYTSRGRTVVNAAAHGECNAAKGSKRK